MRRTAMGRGLLAGALAVTLLCSHSCHVHACSGHGCGHHHDHDHDHDDEGDGGTTGKPDPGAGAGAAEAALEAHRERLGWPRDGGAFERVGHGADAGGGRWLVYRRRPGTSGLGGRALVRLDAQGRWERLVGERVVAAPR